MLGSIINNYAIKIKYCHAPVAPMEVTFAPKPVHSATISPRVCAEFCSHGGRGSTFLAKDLSLLSSDPQRSQLFSVATNTLSAALTSCPFPCTPHTQIPDHDNSLLRVTRTGCPWASHL